MEKSKRKYKKEILFFLMISLISIIYSFVLNIAELSLEKSKIFYFLFLLLFYFTLYFRKIFINKEEKIISLMLLLSFLPKMYLASLFGYLLIFIYIILQKKKILEKIKGLYFENKNLFLIFFLIVIWGIVSWLYNLIIYKRGDMLSILFWGITYLFPFLLIVLLLVISKKVDYNKILNFYLINVFIEFNFLIGKMIAQNKFYLVDYGTGSCFNAHSLGLHFAIANIIILNKLLDTLSLKNKLSKFKKFSFDFIFYIFLLIFFTSGFFITDSKAILLLWTITFFFFLFKEILFKIFQGNVFKITIFTLSLILIIFILFHFFIPDLIMSYYKDITHSLNNILVDKRAGKIYGYLLIPKIWKDPNYNLLFGSGPGTYTSKASRVRMGEIADHKLPVPLKTYISDIYKKYIYKAFYTGEYGYKKKSWSTATSPMTSINSIIVELGLCGFIFFITFFSITFYNFIKFNLPISLYLFLLFIFLLFYLNYWEDPLSTIPIFIFTFTPFAQVKK